MTSGASVCVSAHAHKDFSPAAGGHDTQED
jgi:hypothetical protein